MKEKPQKMDLGSESLEISNNISSKKLEIEFHLYRTN